MSAIIHDKWGGLVPKLKPLALPGRAAQIAKNVDLTCGKLRPAAYTTPFQRLHDDDGAMVGQLVAGIDIASVTKPAAFPAATTLKMLGAAGNWIKPYAGVWATYIDPDDQTAKVMELRALSALSSPFSYWSGEGFVLRANLGTVQGTFRPNIVYRIHGPKYQLRFSADTKYEGGPEAALTVPTDVVWSSPDYPIINMPFAWPISMASYPDTWAGARYTYAYASLIDVGGPRCDTEVYHEQGTSVLVNVVLSCHVEFFFRLDYVRNSEQFVQYVRTYIDQAVVLAKLYALTNSGAGTIRLDTMTGYVDEDIPDTGTLLLEPDTPANLERVTYTSWTKAAGVYTFVLSGTTAKTHAADVQVNIENIENAEMEGPPSELTDVISVNPGEIVKLTADIATRYRQQKIYRTEDAGENSLLIDREVTHDTMIADGATHVFYDDFQQAPSKALPPYGNFPHATLADACVNSVVHPNQWAAIIYKNELRPSDAFRLHAYPEEWALRFPTRIMAQVLAGGSIVVFTEADTATNEQGKVFVVSGSDPSALSMYEVANVSPLLIKTSIARVDDRVYYASRDGIMVIGGNVPKLITEQLFDRPGWTNERPDIMQAWVCDRALFLLLGAPETGLLSGNYLRFDFDEGLATCTRFTKLENIQEFEWKSRPFDLGRLCGLGWVQVTADAYPVIVMLYDDRDIMVGQRAVMGPWPERMPMTPLSRIWSYRVKARATVQRIALATSAPELLGPAI